MQNSKYNSNSSSTSNIDNLCMDLKTFSYTAELEQAAKGSKWNDTLADFTKIPRPVLWDSPNNTIDGNHFTLKSSLVSLLEFKDNLFYFFTQQS